MPQAGTEFMANSSENLVYTCDVTDVETWSFLFSYFTPAIHQYHLTLSFCSCSDVCLRSGVTICYSRKEVSLREMFLL